MTESKRGRTTRTAPAEASTTAPTEVSTDVPAPSHPDATGNPTPPATPPATTPLTLTIRLPFFTATLSGPQRASAAAPPAPGARSPGGSLQKLAFYGGVATMGALGAIDWPVAFAVAAGTWVAQHTPPAVGSVPRRRAGVPEPTEREPAPAPAGV
jgi:hypothetical protein